MEEKFEFVTSAGFDAEVFEGTARVFDGEQGAMDAVTEGTLQTGDVVVIRYEGPKGGPGMREMLAITGAIKGAGLGKDVLLLTDGLISVDPLATMSLQSYLRTGAGRLARLALVDLSPSQVTPPRLTR